MDVDIKRLPDGELDIMQALWSFGGRAKSRELEAVLKESHPMAITTLLTMLGRLESKGFVKVRKEGRTSLYEAAVKEEDYAASQSRRFLDRVCRGSMSAFAAALTDSGISRDDLDELRRLLEENRL